MLNTMLIFKTPLKKFPANSDIKDVGLIVPLPITICPICLKGGACCRLRFVTGFFGLGGEREDGCLTNFLPFHRLKS